MMVPMEKRQPMCIPSKGFIFICFALFFLMLETFTSQRQIRYPVCQLTASQWKDEVPGLCEKSDPENQSFYLFSSEKEVDHFQLTPESTIKKRNGC